MAPPHKKQHGNNRKGEGNLSEQVICVSEEGTAHRLKHYNANCATSNANDTSHTANKGHALKNAVAKKINDVEFQ